jgi:tetratricopeptide (TPR) repeat protein
MAFAARSSVADLHKSLKSDPNDTRALLRLAELEAKAGHDAVACDTYTRAGDVFVRQGFARRALSSFTLALAVARDGALVDKVAPIARAMGKLYAQERLVREAITVLDSAARWLIERGFDASALPVMSDRIAIDDTEVARVRLAETYFRLGRPEQAGNELVAVFGRLHAQGRRDEALDVAERLLGERPHLPIARAAAELYLGRRRHGDPFLALAKLRICCEDDPTDVSTLELLARAFDLAGHGEKAGRVRREIALLAKPAVPRPASVPPRPSAAPAPRVSAIRPKVQVVPRPAPAAPIAKTTEDSISVDVDAAWDELLVAEPAPSERIDPSRASFWPDDDRPAPDRSGSIVSVSLADVELVDAGAPASAAPPASLLETALECIESLVAQGRYDEAQTLVVRHLAIRPRNPLLLERKTEIDDMLGSFREGPPPALFGFNPRGRGKDSERSIPTAARAAG